MFYPTIRNIVVVHYTYATLWGIAHPDEPMLVGVRDAGLVRSALGAMRAAYEDQEPPGIAGKAATLLRSLIKNHAFLDGNKRTAVLCTFLFVDKNGWEVQAPPNAWTALASAVAAHEGAYPMKNLRKQVRGRIGRSPSPGKDHPISVIRHMLSGMVESQGFRMWATDRQDDHGKPLESLWLRRKHGQAGQDDSWALRHPTGR